MSGNKIFNLKAFVIATLRRASYRSPQRNQAMTNARVERGKYVCTHCRGVYGRREVAVDHIIPVVPLTGWDGWDGFIERLFTGNIQVLCKPCHKVKTLAENRERRYYAKKNPLPKP